MTSPARHTQDTRPVRRSYNGARVKAAIKAIAEAGFEPVVTIEGARIEVRGVIPGKSADDEAARLDRQMREAFGSKGCAA